MTFWPVFSKAAKKCKAFFLPVLLLILLFPGSARACVFCLEHMGMDASMYWTNDIMLSFRFNDSDIWIAGSRVQAGYSHIGGSQLLVTQENTLQVLVTGRWMVQVTEPIYYRWNWNPAASGTSSYSAGAGNNNSGFLSVPGDLWIANLFNLYDHSNFSGSTRIVGVLGVHLPTSPTIQAFNNQNITSSLTGSGGYELTTGLEAMHTFANGRWMVVGDGLYSFELPNSLGTQPGNVVNTDAQLEYRVTPLHSRLPEIWISTGNYIQYNSANQQVTASVLNGQTLPVGPVPATENLEDSVGVGFQIMPHSFSNLMIFGNADKFVYWNQPGSTPGNPALNPDFKVLAGFMWMF